MSDFFSISMKKMRFKNNNNLKREKNDKSDKHF